MQTIFQELREEWVGHPVFEMIPEWAGLECAVCEEPLMMGQSFYWKDADSPRSCAHVDCVPIESETRTH